MNGFAAPRPQPRPTHRACPFRVFYPDRAAAEHAAARLGSQVQDCTRCSGFHMTLPAVTTTSATSGGGR